MNCNRAEEYLVEYLYQELSAQKTLEIERHLQSCGRCAKTLESWRAIHLGYQRTSEEPAVAPYVIQKILIAAEQEISRPASWSERLMLGLKIATVPLAIFVVLIILNATNKESKIASHKDKPAAPPALVAPMAEQQAVQPTAQDYAEPKRKAESSYGGAREETRKQDGYADKLEASRDYRYRSDAPAEMESDEDSSRLKDAASGAAAPEPPSSAPSPVYQSAPPAAKEEMAMKNSETSVAQKLGKVAGNKSANELLQEVQTDLEQNKVDSAVKKTRDYIEQDTQRSNARQIDDLANSYQQRGEFGKAIPQYELVRSNYSNYENMDDMLMRLGDSYAELGQFDQAVKAYNQVRSPAQQKVATQKIQKLQKKQEAQEQLRSLGYVGKDKE